ncbi:MAG TPA: hypothetical protein VFP94_07870 [Terriglobales bacterium]|nr:hypothetical protein [Terriglobales bacterium]
MRTTVDLPDSVYRSLKVKASMQGVTFKKLLLEYVERGLREPEHATKRGRKDEPPVIIPPTGQPIPLLSANEIRRLEEIEDLAKLG